MVDSNIVLSAVFGERTRNALLRVGASRQLLASQGTSHEVQVLLTRNDRFRKASGTTDDLFAIMTILPFLRYETLIDVAAAALRNAVPSRNGNARDAHVLALAWTLDADIWSHDRDFAGTGWPSWSTANLVAALGPSGVVEAEA